jgi:hypothetical protein
MQKFSWCDPHFLASRHRREYTHFDYRTMTPRQARKGGHRMKGLMQDWQLTTNKILEHAKRVNPTREIVTRRVEGNIERITYGDLFDMSKQVSTALKDEGIGLGDRIATLAWNSGAILRPGSASWAWAASTTRSIRACFPEQIAWIMNHAPTGSIFDDLTFMPIVEAKDSIPSVEVLQGHRHDRRRPHARERAAQCRVLRGMADGRRRRFPNGPMSARMPPAACATPPARRAIRRACSIRTAPTFCTP